MRTRLARVTILGAVTLLAPACQTTAPTERLEARGVYVRQERIRVDPASVEAFERLLRRTADAAADADLDPEPFWLCYREAPTRYWIIRLAHTPDGFLMPEGLAPMARILADAAGTRPEIDELLRAADYETEWRVVWQQVDRWSTVESMSTDEHPKARFIEYRVRPGMAGAFDDAAAALAAFLADHEYPLPVEGFVARAGAPNRTANVIFPVDWPSFHAGRSLEAFAEGLPPGERAELARLRRAIALTVSRIEQFDSDFAPALSYSP